MRRSEINAILRQADAFIRQQGFHLPPFAYWPPSTWAQRKEEAQEIIERGLGWDITDFGLGDYPHWGLFLFTLRNGQAANLAQGRGKVYAEKIMVVEVNQITPMHFHWVKTEDIINRGGGRLSVRLYNAAPDESLAATDVVAQIDGLRRTVRAGDVVTLAPGESITLPPHCYHEFWGSQSRVLVGEVSTVNDDHTDNRFLQPVGRFPVVEEDEPPLHLLVSDYAQI